MCLIFYRFHILDTLNIILPTHEMALILPLLDIFWWHPYIWNLVWDLPNVFIIHELTILSHYIFRFYIQESRCYPPNRKIKYIAIGKWLSKRKYIRSIFSTQFWKWKLQHGTIYAKTRFELVRIHGSVFRYKKVAYDNKKRLNNRICCQQVIFRILAIVQYILFT